MRGKFQQLFHCSSIGDICFRFMYATTALGLLVPLASLLFVGEQKSWFAWYVLFLPALWCVWTIFAIILANRHHIFRLIFVWLLIDFSALVFLISFSMGMENWEKSNGADLVLYTMYFPMIMPSMKIINGETVKTVESIVQGYAFYLPISIREVVAIWLIMSLLAAFQSTMVVSISLLLKKCYSLLRTKKYERRNR